MDTESGARCYRAVHGDQSLPEPEVTEQTMSYVNIHELFEQAIDRGSAL